MCINKMCVYAVHLFECCHICCCYTVFVFSFKSLYVVLFLWLDICVFPWSYNWQMIRFDLNSFRFDLISFYFPVQFLSPLVFGLFSTAFSFWFPFWSWWCLCKLHPKQNAIVLNLSCRNIFFFFFYLHCALKCHLYSCCNPDSNR